MMLYQTDLRDFHGFHRDTAGLKPKSTGH